MLVQAQIFHAHHTRSSAMTVLMILAYFLYRGNSREPGVAQIRFSVPAQAAHAALQNGLQGGEVIVVGGEAQVVDEQNELQGMGGRA